jgi:hypothetical protein
MLVTIQSIKRKGKRPSPSALPGKAKFTQLIIPVAGRCVAIWTVIRVVRVKWDERLKCSDSIVVLHYTHVRWCGVLPLTI